MADDLRARVMTPGHCTFCGAPAERGLYGAWWHIGQPCNPAYGVVPAAQWPPRFKPGPCRGPDALDQSEATG